MNQAVKPVAQDEDPLQKRFLAGAGVGLAEKLHAACAAGVIALVKTKGVGIGMDNPAASGAVVSAKEALAAELGDVAASLVSGTPLPAQPSGEAIASARVDDAAHAVEGDPAQELERTLRRAQIQAQSLRAQGKGEQAAEILKAVFSGTAETATPQAAEKPKEEVVFITLGLFARMDLAERLAQASQKNHQIRLEEGGSTLRSEVFRVEDRRGARVCLRVLESTGEFAKVFRKGFKFFQDELYGLRKAEGHSEKSTKALHLVIGRIEQGIRDSRRQQVPKPHQQRRHSARKETQSK